jgi:hypothetical protein
MQNKSDCDARIFFVDTRFQRMARRPGGVPRTQALENAQSKIADSTPEFEAWLDRELQALADLMAKVHGRAAEAGWSEAICGHCRQLRDVGTTMGYELLTFVANNLCAILEAAVADDEGNIETIICHIDAMLLARQKQYRHLRPEQVPELSKGLRLVAETVNPGSGDSAG